MYNSEDGNYSPTRTIKKSTSAFSIRHQHSFKDNIKLLTRKLNREQPISVSSKIDPRVLGLPAIYGVPFDLKLVAKNSINKQIELRPNTFQLIKIIYTNLKGF